ncbi:MAG: hypothetical protein EBT98_12245 [Opitutaceae bacterium]|nr:hypothetical protein [Opitutaceae bacterium]
MSWIAHRAVALCLKTHLKAIRPKLSTQKVIDHSQNPLGGFRQWANKNAPMAFAGSARWRRYDADVLVTFLTAKRFPLLKGYKRTWPANISITPPTGVVATGQTGFVVPVILPSATLPTAKRIKALEALVAQKCQENALLQRQLGQANAELAALRQKRSELSAINSAKARRNTGERRK